MTEPSATQPGAAPQPPGDEPPRVTTSPRAQTIVGAGVLVVAALMAWGASAVQGDAGYGGVGPAFVPWMCALALAVCGAWLVWEARTGGFRDMGDPGGGQTAQIGPFVWVSAGLLLNAALIEHLGFVLSCTLCYALAVQGLRRAAEPLLPLQAARLLKDAVVGALISAPVFWMFTQFLAINLPGLTQTGWL